MCLVREKRSAVLGLFEHFHDSLFDETRIPLVSQNNKQFHLVNWTALCAASIERARPISQFIEHFTTSINQLTSPPQVVTATSCYPNWCAGQTDDYVSV